MTLHRVLGRKLVQELPRRDLTRLQVAQVNPTAFIPVEFVCDLLAPTNDAGLCKNWRKALEEPCSPEHHPVDPDFDNVKVVYLDARA